MQAGRRLKDTFRARDGQGQEYEVRVYVYTSGGPAAGGPGAEHASGTEARVLTGPLAGETFNATPDGGDVYRVHVTGSDRAITRVR